MTELERLLEEERLRRAQVKELSNLRNEAAKQAMAEVEKALDIPAIQKLKRHYGRDTVKVYGMGGTSIQIYTDGDGITISAGVDSKTNALSYTVRRSYKQTYYDGPSKEEAISACLKEIVKDVA